MSRLQRGTGSLKSVPLFERYGSLIIIALFLRLLLTGIPSYSIDMGGYTAWSDYLAKNGPAGLYGESGYHIVYAPFFQYFLWLTGEIKALFSLSTGFQAYLIKIWSVLFEALGGCLLFLLSKKYKNEEKGIILALIFFINPAVIMNSSVWGQFDSVPAAMLLGVLYLFEAKQKNAAALLFLVAVLTKPQSGLLLPVVLYLYFRDFRMDFKHLSRLATGLAGGVVLYLLIVLPFYNPTAKAGNPVPQVLDPFYWLFELYSRSMDDYPYATANAFNFWYLLGGQTQDDGLSFLGLTYSLWGYILLACVLGYAFFMLIKGRASAHALAYFSFLVLFSAFMFMSRMHERYLLPAVSFIMLSLIWNKRHVLTAVLTSLCVFSNHLYLYLVSFEKRYWLDPSDGIALFLSFLTLVTYGLAVFDGYKLFIETHNKKKGMEVQ